MLSVGSCTTESLACNSKTRKIPVEKENIIGKMSFSSILSFLIFLREQGKKEEEEFEEGIHSDSLTLNSVYK